MNFGWQSKRTAESCWMLAFEPCDAGVVDRPVVCSSKGSSAFSSASLGRIYSGRIVGRAVVIVSQRLLFCFTPWTPSLLLSCSFSLCFFLLFLLHDGASSIKSAFTPKRQKTGVQSQCAHTWCTRHSVAFLLKPVDAHSVNP